MPGCLAKQGSHCCIKQISLLHNILRVLHSRFLHARLKRWQCGNRTGNRASPCCSVIEIPLLSLAKISHMSTIRAPQSEALVTGGRSDEALAWRWPMLHPLQGRNAALMSLPLCYALNALHNRPCCTCTKIDNYTCAMTCTSVPAHLLATTDQLEPTYNNAGVTQALVDDHHIGF